MQTRRQLLKSAALVAGVAAGVQTRAQAAPLAMPPLDYGRSFICNTADFNRVRFWVESRTRLIDAENDTTTDYYQCGSCKSEDTFAESGLFMKDNYDFLPIWGGGQWLVFRRTVRLSESYRTIYPAEKLWGEPILKLCEAAGTKVLDTWEAIRDTTAEAIPIVAQTEISNSETGLLAIIEYPVKTMNISVPKQMYQVDTGPVALPDLSKRFDQRIDCLSPAFVAFNAPHFADFVVEQPTTIELDNPGGTQTYHYSNPISLPAANRLLAVIL